MTTRDELRSTIRRAVADADISTSSGLSDRGPSPRCRLLGADYGKRTARIEDRSTGRTYSIRSICELPGRVIAQLRASGDFPHLLRHLVPDGFDAESIQRRSFGDVWCVEAEGHDWIDDESSRVSTATIRYTESRCAHCGCHRGVTRYPADDESGEPMSTFIVLTSAEEMGSARFAEAYGLQPPCELCGQPRNVCRC